MWRKENLKKTVTSGNLLESTISVGQRPDPLITSYGRKTEGTLHSKNHMDLLSHFDNA